MSRIDELLEQARARLTRVDPAAARAAIDAGAVLVDIRAESQRRRDGVVPGSVFIARNVLEWRCDPPVCDRAGSHRDERVVSDPERPLTSSCATPAFMSSSGRRDAARAPRARPGDRPRRRLSGLARGGGCRSSRSQPDAG